MINGKSKSVTVKGVFAWAYQRYINGYSFFSSLLAVVNSAGIFLLLFKQIFGLSEIIVLPILVVCSVVAFITFAVIMFDIFKLQNDFQRKSGEMNEYWGKRLTPIQVKQTLLLLDAIERKDRINELKKKVQGEYL